MVSGTHAVIKWFVMKLKVEQGCGSKRDKVLYNTGEIILSDRDQGLRGQDLGLQG